MEANSMRTAGVINTFVPGEPGFPERSKCAVRDDESSNDIYQVRMKNYGWLLDHLPLVGKRIRFTRTLGSDGLVAEEIELE